MKTKNSSFDNIFDTNIFGNFFKENALKAPTEVQLKVSSPLLSRKDIAFVSQTGTGKTYAFALPVIELLKKSEKQAEHAPGSPRAIILAPTRELATQLTKVLKEITHHAKLRVRQLSKNSRTLKTQEFDILVGNPGGLFKAVRCKDLSLDAVEHFIFDEADQLMDMGFAKEIHEVVKRSPKEGLQHIMVTATRPQDFEAAVNEFLPHISFELIDLVGRDIIQKDIETFHLQVSDKQKPLMLEGFLKEKAQGSGIIFVNRKDQVITLMEFLKDKTKKALIPLHGGMGQKERQKEFARFREKKGILLATDIAARGIDIKGISWVLNYDLPTYPVYYLHRAGRCARGDIKAKGSVINFVTARDEFLVNKINDAIKNQNVLKLTAIRAPKKSAKKTTKKKATDKVSKKTGHAKKSFGTKQKRTPRYKRK